MQYTFAVNSGTLSINPNTPSNRFCNTVMLIRINILILMLIKFNYFQNIKLTINGSTDWTFSKMKGKNENKS